jgi:F420-0:gamma-glutamyl ligase-like protein
VKIKQIHQTRNQVGEHAIFLKSESNCDLSNTETSRWNSEPTSSEKQRENLTERLKREFGLFLDEQEKIVKEKGRFSYLSLQATSY